jgi:hypothetical protein
MHVKRCNSYERTYYKTDFISGVYKWLFYDKNGYAVMYDNDGYALTRNKDGSYQEMNERDKNYVDNVYKIIVWLIHACFILGTLFVVRAVAILNNNQLFLFLFISLYHTKTTILYH